MDENLMKNQIEQEVISAFNDTRESYQVKSVSADALAPGDGRGNVQVTLGKTSGFRLEPGGSSSKTRLNNSRHSDCLTVAMVYQNQTIGEIEVTLSDQGMDIDNIRLIFERIAMDIAFLIKRQQVHAELKQVRKLDLPWIGRSQLAKTVDRFVERVCGVDFPVVISGEIGSGKLFTAYAIHSNGPRKKEPFVEGYCANWKGDEVVDKMRELWVKAGNGTLFLHDLDVLSSDQMLKIRHYWRHVVSGHSIKQDQKSRQARLIASVSEQSTPDDSCSWHELDYLSIQLPSLRDRPDDIKALVEHYLNKLSYIKSVELSDNCWALFERFDWQDNVRELERMVSKLVVMSDTNYLDTSALLAIIPQLKDEQGEKIDLPASRPESNGSPLNVDQIALKIATNDYQGEVNHHPALAKAVAHIADNYTQEISLGELASMAYVSPSHLSYLFKHHLNCSFKQLLISARIARSKQLLIEKKHSKIIEIAFDVGFHDLSHFEKVFKRLVGVSPGRYRK